MLLSQPDRQPIRHAPQFDDLALNITYRCNLACSGCNRGGFVKPCHGPDMTMARLAGILAEAEQSGVTIKKLRIVGAEPTLHPDFERIVQTVVQFSRHHGCQVLIFSNRHAVKSQAMLKMVRQRWPRCRMPGRRKERRVVFPPLTRYIYVSPHDAGVDCPLPCPIMGGRGICGYGVDPAGYYLCPTGGTIDSILGLNAAARTMDQMLDPSFVAQQAATLCGHCGNYYRFAPLPPTWDCNGTPVSETYRKALLAKGFTVNAHLPSA
jgi:hypothetical protein